MPTNAIHVDTARYRLMHAKRALGPWRSSRAEVETDAIDQRQGFRDARDGRVWLALDCWIDLGPEPGADGRGPWRMPAAARAKDEPGLLAVVGLAAVMTMGVIALCGDGVKG